MADEGKIAKRPSWVQRHRSLLMIVGALLVFATYVLKDG
jgi:hypothetical protein